MVLSLGLVDFKVRLRLTVLANSNAFKKLTILNNNFKTKYAEVIMKSWPKLPLTFRRKTIRAKGEFYIARRFTDDLLVIIEYTISRKEESLLILTACLSCGGHRETWPQLLYSLKACVSIFLL